ncbi:MAG TPA: hypothetical protein VKC60_09425, partial [Opitutaceae bacterium]|nr:hypothetical protein [Opitutaceae bacterium]
MSTLSFSRVRLLSVATAIAMLVTSCTTTSTVPAVKSDATLYAGLKSLDYAGTQEAREALQNAIDAAGQDRAELAVIEANLLKILQEPDIT